MAAHQTANFEKVCDVATPIYCPIEDQNSNLFVVSSNGDIYQINENLAEPCFSTSGQPTGIVFDQNEAAFIADVAHQAILSQSETDNRIEITPVVKEHEGNALLGPNSLILAQESNTLFFTDSGPFGETNLQNATGSIFAVDLEVNVLKPLMYKCLAYPCGLALSINEMRLYVAETCRNRILRFVQGPHGVYHCSTFYQFSGRFGPTALAMHVKGFLFVARYDFSSCSKEGLISVLSESGELVMDITIPGTPEISGLFFSKTNEDILYMTENTHNSLMKILVSLK
jgi:sugar lactone lactonase YvrE